MAANKINKNVNIELPISRRMQIYYRIVFRYLQSLMALTTHFAQVQFRLHQVVEAPERERLDI